MSDERQSRDDILRRFLPYWIVRVTWLLALLALALRAGSGQIPVEALLSITLALLVQGVLYYLARIDRLPTWHDLLSAGLAALLGSLVTWFHVEHQLAFFILMVVPLWDLARSRGADALFLLAGFPIPLLLGLYSAGQIDRIYLPPLIVWLIVNFLAVSMAKPESRDDNLTTFLPARILWVLGLLMLSWDPALNEIPAPLLAGGILALLLHGGVAVLVLSGRLPKGHDLVAALVAVPLSAMALWTYPERQALLLLFGLLPVLDLARWRGYGALFALVLFPIPIQLPLFIVGDITSFDILALVAWLITAGQTVALALVRSAHQVAQAPVAEAVPTNHLPEIFERTTAQMLSPESDYERILATLVRGGCEILNEGSLKSQARAIALTFYPGETERMGVAALYNLEPEIVNMTFELQGVLGTLMYEGEPLDTTSEQPPFDRIRSMWDYRLVLLPVRSERDLYGAVIFATRDDARVENLEVQNALIELAAGAGHALHLALSASGVVAAETEVVASESVPERAATAAPDRRGDPVERARRQHTATTAPVEAGRRRRPATILASWGAGLAWFLDRLGEQVAIAVTWPFRQVARIRPLRVLGQTASAMRSQVIRSTDALLERITPAGERIRGTLSRPGPDLGPRPLLFAGLALMTGIGVGIVPMMLTGMSLWGVLAVVSLPLVAVIGLTLYSFWQRNSAPATMANVVAMPGGGALALGGPTVATRPALAGRPVALPVTETHESTLPTPLEWGLIILVFTTYTRFSDVLVHDHGLPSIAQPLVAVLLLAIAMAAFLGRGRFEGWQRPAPLLAAYGFVRAGSLVYASAFAPAQAALIDYTKDAIIALVVVLLLQRGAALRWAIWALLAAGIFLGTISAVQYLSGSFMREFLGFGKTQVMHIIGVTEDFRLGGPLGEPNAYAQFLLPLVALAVERMWHERRVVLRLLAAWALVVVLLTIVFTFSRGALVSVGAMAFVALIHRPPKPREVMIAVLLGAVLFPFIPSQYTDRMATLLEFLPGVEKQPTQEVSFRGRTSELMVGWMMFQDHPILGVGLHNYPIHYQDYSRQLGLDPRREQRAPHSLYLEVMAELGILGILTFGAILWSVFHGIHVARIKLAFLGRREYANMLAGLSIGIIGYMTAAIFLHGAYPRFFWLLVGIALAAPQLVRREDRLELLSSQRRSPVRAA